MLDLDRLLVLAEGTVEDGRLAGEPVGRRALPVPEHGFERGEHAQPCRPVGRAPHFTSDSSARLLSICGSTRSVSAQIDSNGPAFGTDAHDGVGSGLPHVLHRVQPEVDDAADNGEVLLRRVHVRRRTSMPISRQALT